MVRKVRAVFLASPPAPSFTKVIFGAKAHRVGQLAWVVLGSAFPSVSDKARKGHGSIDGGSRRRRRGKKKIRSGRVPGVPATPGWGGQGERGRPRSSPRP